MYINGIGSISGQAFQPREGQVNFHSNFQGKVLCTEPDYSGLIPPMQLRRMSKVVRIGIAAAKSALADAGLSSTDVITLGTAYGCLADTEVFLGKLLQQDEQMLTPTAFIQSTHNTVSGQIALLLGCHGHNFTFVHRGHSWESALQEAWMMIQENPDQHILCGGIDELTEHSRQIITRFGTHKEASSMFSTPGKGCLPGEGSHLFSLSGKPGERTYAEIVGLYLCGDGKDPAAELDLFLQQNAIDPLWIQKVYDGRNGDERYDASVLTIFSRFSQTKLIPYKQFCGEYPTAGAFGMALAAADSYQASKNGSDQEAKPGYRLVHNHYKNQYHSFILLKPV